MQTAHTIAALRQALPTPGACAFVPTMGNLHEGHLDLVRQAARHGLPVVASVFVNRLQFAPNEDFDRYPRTLEADAAQLAKAGCNLLFAPDEHELYPTPQAYTVHPDPALADILEGHFRPGFFRGVCTVVMKLFGCVQPRVAVFGKKDYQQWRVIERMAQQFALPIAIEGVETRRAPDGLALSSRNGYLSEAERQRATALSSALALLAERCRALGTAALPEQAMKSLAQLEGEAMKSLAESGWTPDYLTVRRRTDLLPPDPVADAHTPLVALGAARLGGTRLIDNLEF